MQKTWIGESEGTTINFKFKDTNEEIPIFTTRADTIHGNPDFAFTKNP